jgi:hypothetical protein
MTMTNDFRISAYQSGIGEVFRVTEPTLHRATDLARRSIRLHPYLNIVVIERRDNKSQTGWTRVETLYN